MERMERRGRRRKQLLDDVKKQISYRNLEEEAIVRNFWRTIFRRVCGKVAGHTAWWWHDFSVL